MNDILLTTCISPNQQDSVSKGNKSGDCSHFALLGGIVWAHIDKHAHVPFVESTPNFEDGLLNVTKWLNFF